MTGYLQFSNFPHTPIGTGKLEKLRDQWVSTPQKPPTRPRRGPFGPAAEGRLRLVAAASAGQAS